VLKVRDKGRLDAGQAVTWVIQTDGLSLHHVGTDKRDSTELMCTFSVLVSDIKHLGDSSIVTLSTETFPSVQIRMTLTGPQRSNINPSGSMQLQLDSDWVHIMPLVP